MRSKMSQKFRHPERGNNTIRENGIRENAVRLTLGWVIG